MAYSDAAPHHPIIAREGLDFNLGSDIPRFWFEGDPFKTRFLDALSTLFPEGEKFFISCVRDFRDQISDPKLAQDVKEFIRQESQHSIVHKLFNDRLKRQGIPVDAIDAKMAYVFARIRRVMPAVFTLGETAAAEHITAMLAHALFDRREFMQGADPRVRAMYAWHAIEEIEHNAVAFDVLKQVARAGYLARVMPMVMEMLIFPIYTVKTQNLMLKADGFSWRERASMWRKGAGWLCRPGGLFWALIVHVCAYFKPGYHPSQGGAMPNYVVWVNTFKNTADPIAAGNALHAAGR